MQIGDFDRTARLHWLKSCFISNIFLDIDKQTISINLDIPEFNPNYGGFQNRMEWEENYQKLSAMIHDDIFEDVLAVLDIFLENEIKPYIRVKVITNFVPGYSKNQYEEISGIISDLNIILSPNTSKVIEKSLASLTSLCGIEFENYEKFNRYSDQLIKHLKKIYEDRPCHEGLNKIIKRIEALQTTFNEEFDEKLKEDSNFDPKNLRKSEIRELQERLRAEVKKIVEERENYAKDLYARCREPMFENVKNIFLFGFSEMVSNFLNIYCEHHVNFRNTIQLYILECAAKRRFSRNNILDYNDGIHYATVMSKLGFSKIAILPETSMPSLIEDKEIQGNISVVLFGANGIDEDGNVGHTSGHLLIAKIAECYAIPVFVIADTFKKGKWEWKLSSKRKAAWLTADKDIIRELDSRNIERINYREDKLPKELITNLITNQPE